MTRLQAEFENFDHDNPHIWDYFVRFAFEAIERGRKKLSVALIVERIRWEVYLTTTSDTDDFKINNNHRAYYARKWKVKFPAYSAFFSIRRVPADYEILPAVDPTDDHSW